LVIAFDSLWLRAICENGQKADADLGPDIARALRGRLADLDAANSATDLIAGIPRVITDGELEYMAVNLQDGMRIEFMANHVKNPIDGAGHIVWANVSRIKIIGIRHGN
jgi:toxin HigB-1